MEKPILFKPEPVNKIITGEKTETRRLVEPQPELMYDNVFTWKPKDLGNVVFKNKPHKDSLGKVKEWNEGDILWVRETFAYHIEGGIILKANNLDVDNDEVREQTDNGKGWKPSIHMKRDDSRIDLLVEEVKMEKLDEITEEGAKAEGVEKEKEEGTYREAFFKKWDEIHGEESKEKNPFVWVIKFRIYKNEDE